MPNVMGREFPYTPEGMAQAEQYKQAMGMRGGGMMGFRPLGYADGNLVTAMAQRPRREDLEDEGLDVYLGLQSLLEEGDRQKILDYLYQNDGIIQRDRENNPSRSEFFDGVKQFYNYEQYFRDLMQQPDSNFVRTGMVGQDLQAMVDEGFYADPTPNCPASVMKVFMLIQRFHRLAMIQRFHRLAMILGMKFHTITQTS